MNVLQLFKVATRCDVVLCCRVAPLQKAGIVALIKNRTDDMTLAIGDGKFYACSVSLAISDSRASHIKLVKALNRAVQIAPSQKTKIFMYTHTAILMRNIIKKNQYILCVLTNPFPVNYQRFPYLLSYSVAREKNLYFR